MWVTIQVLAACQIQSSVIQCGDRICPATTRCYAGVCANPAALAACNNASNGQDCLVDGSSGVCSDGLCLIQICGNAAIESGEVCDDGNRRDGDGCSADCASTEACGNGIADPNEDCDCGGDDSSKNPRCSGPNSDLPSAECSRECKSRNCGDGIKNGTEDCDGSDFGGATCPSIGLYGGTLGCTSACRYDVVQCERCGDGIVNGGEVCDGPTAGDCSNFGGDFGTARCSVQCTPLTTDCGRTDWTTLLTQPATTRFYSGIGFGDQAVIAGYSDSVRVNGDVVTLIPGITGLGLLAGVSGSSINNVILVGFNGRIFHYDGTTAVPMVSPTNIELKAVYVASPTFALAAGGLRGTTEGILLQYDGTTWQVVPLPPGTSRVYGMKGSSATDVWAGTDLGQILHFDGSKWQLHSQVADRIRGFTYDDEGNLWATGNNFIWLLRDGAFQQMLSIYKPSVASDGKNLFAIGYTPGPAPNAELKQHAFWWNGRRWLQLVTDPPFSIRAVIGGAGRIWVAGEGKLAKLNDYFWHLPAVASTGDTPKFRGVWGASNGDIFAGDGVGNLYSSHNDTWSKTPIGGAGFHSLWGSSSNDLYAAGLTLSATAIWHWDGGQWTQSLPSTIGFFKVTGLDKDHVYALGLDRKVFMWNGTQWSTMLDLSSEAGSLYDLVARAPNDVYVLGVKLLRHFDGVTWTDLAPPTIGKMKSLIVVAPNDIWVMGRLDQGRVGFRIHWNGTQWSEPVRTRSALRRTAPFIGNQILAVGRWGGASLLSNAEWSEFRMPKDYDGELFDITKYGDNSWLFSLSRTTENAIVLRRR
jgi:cysteine-rich repeat protein